MGINQLSPELLTLIIHHIGYPLTPSGKRLPAQSHLFNARLVCRRWNEAIIPNVFNTATLSPTEEGFRLWKKMLDDETIRSVVRRVVIRSTPSNLREDRPWSVWGPWEEEGEYPEFTAAISRILEIPHLQEVCLRFSSRCLGIEKDSSYDDDVEVMASRLHTLKAVFDAVRHRAGRNPPTNVHSLTIKNLQNLAILDFTSSPLFKSVAKGLDELHLQVTHEYNEHGPDHDIYCIELVEFEPYMHEHWLLPLASQLTTLTLSFRECWGVMPGVFDGHGLVFPRLKTLNLGYYTIAHHNQFDWVLAQTSLKHLRLDRCFIASHLRTEKDKVREWQIPTGDWEKLPSGAFGFYFESDAVYRFSGTWKTIFDNVRTRLPNLMDFRFHIHEWKSIGFLKPQELHAKLSPLRYITFDIGLCPTRWIEAQEPDGEMEFGNNDPSIFDPDAGENKYKIVCSLNRSKETEEEDFEALQALLEATRDCRRRP